MSLYQHTYHGKSCCILQNAITPNGNFRVIIYWKYSFKYILKIHLEIAIIGKTFLELIQIFLNQNSKKHWKSEFKKAFQFKLEFELSTFNNWLLFRICPNDLIHLIKGYVNNYTQKFDWLQKTIPVGLDMLRLIEELSSGRKDLQKAVCRHFSPGEKNLSLFYVFYSTSSKLDSNNLRTVSAWIIRYDCNERQSHARFFWSHFRDLFKLMRFSQNKL